MRAFIGIDFPEGLKKQITELQRRLRPYASSGRWKREDNFHLTLKFLGEINPLQADRIKEALRDICGRNRPFGLNIAKLGTFPGRESIRVLWIGLGGEIDMLSKLQNEIETGMKDLGFEPEARPYSPHITIGQDIVLKGAAEGLNDKALLKGLDAISAQKVTIFKSEQIGCKRVYTSIGEFPLRG